MLVGLVCAAGTSVCYGFGSVLQAFAAGEVDATSQGGLRLLLGLMRGWRYLLGLFLDGVGFVLSLVALASLPLYVVQSVVASFLAVAAVGGALFLGTPLRRAEQVALAVVVLGLALVGLSAGPQSAAAPGASLEWLLLAAGAGLSLVALRMARWGGARAAWALGGVAGLAFGVVAVGARALSVVVVHGPWVDRLQQLLESPALYALVVAAPLALMTYAAALQLPALVGLLVLGDHPRPGWGVAAATGFALAVGAALLLSRFGEATASRS